MKDILRADGRAANATLGEGHVLRHVAVEVVADHEHVEVFVQRVHSVRPRRVGAGRQDVGEGGDADDVRGMAAARALGVVGVDRPALEGRDGRFDETRLVEGVGVDRDLDVVLVGDAQRLIDGGGGGAPILV